MIGCSWRYILISYVETLTIGSNATKFTQITLIHRGEGIPVTDEPTQLALSYGSFALSGASVILGLAIPALGYEAPWWLPIASVVIAVLLVAFAVWVAVQAQRKGTTSQDTLRTGGAGGHARVSGKGSGAWGGDGGHGGGGEGGRGGDAEVLGDNSIACGGRGGDAASTRR